MVFTCRHNNQEKQGHLPPHVWTMRRRILDKTIPTSQKGNFPHSSYAIKHRKPNHSPCSPCSLCSLRPRFPSSSLPAHRSPSPSHSQPSPALPDSEATLPIIITSALWRWLQDHGLAGFIKVAEASCHPNSIDIATKLNVDTITNAMIRKKLGLSNTGE